MYNWILFFLSFLLASVLSIEGFDVQLMNAEFEDPAARYSMTFGRPAAQFPKCLNVIKTFHTT